VFAALQKVCDTRKEEEKISAVHVFPHSHSVIFSLNLFIVSNIPDKASRGNQSFDNDINWGSYRLIDNNVAVFLIQLLLF